MDEFDLSLDLFFFEFLHLYAVILDHLACLMKPVDSIQDRCQNHGLRNDSQTKGHSEHDPVVLILPVSLVRVHELQRQCKIAPCKDKDKQDNQVDAEGTLTFLLLSLLSKMRCGLAFTRLGLVCIFRFKNGTKVFF